MSPRFRRILAILVGVVAVTVPALSWVEADSGRKEEQAFVDASRGALDIFVKLASSSPRQQFEIDALRKALAIDAEAASRGATAEPGLPLDFALALGPAASRAAERVSELGSAMSAVPEEGSGLDPATVESLASDVSELGPVVEAQGAAVDEAGVHGTRQERGMFALGLAAIAAALLGLAGLMGSTTAGRTALVSAAVALSVAIVAGASGYVL